ncbi:MAG: PorV/PorQ family protein, partial [Rhodothermales bacterium]
MKSLLLTLVLVLVVGPQMQTALAQDERPDVLDHPRDKRAQTGMQFLSVSMSPRAAALGDAMVATDVGTSMAMFYNPAAMASLNGGDLSVGTIQWIADISYNGASIGYSPAGGRLGTFAFTAVSVDYGEIEGTIRSSSDLGYERIGTFSPSALALGLGYARSLSDRFSVGGGVRYVHQDLGNSIMDASGTTQGNSVSTPVFDFGVLYRTGFRSLNVGMSARNFSPTVTYEQEAFETPLLLAAGASMDMLDVVAPA